MWGMLSAVQSRILSSAPVSSSTNMNMYRTSFACSYGWVLNMVSYTKGVI